MDIGDRKNSEHLPSPPSSLHTRKPFVTILDGEERLFRKPKIGNIRVLPVSFIPTLKKNCSTALTFAANRLSTNPINLSDLRKFLPLVLVAIVSISVGANVYLASARYPMPSSGLLLPDEETALSALMAYIDPEDARRTELPAGTLAPLPVSVSITSYTVRSGDTLEKIAKRFGLRQDSIISINNLQSQGAIRSGAQLRIPNIDGVNHRVKRGENLSTIARVYGQDMIRIVDANDLASSTISAGQNLFIPNARLASATLRDFYGERFVWPVRGRISSAFGYRTHPFTGLRSFHSAIDIVTPTGTKIKATSDGKIADTGYNSVFGNYVIVKHDNGYQSLYAHLSSVGVRRGNSVAQGSIIGLSGNSGQSTGPHLHFSIFKNGQALDPLKLVK